jgi:hypothetical protein
MNIRKKNLVMVLFVFVLLVNQSKTCAADYKPDPNMTKWGPKLSEEELAKIAKLPKQELVEMLKTGDMMHAFAALKQLKSEARGGLKENFNLLLNIAAEKGGDLIVEGLVEPAKPTAAPEEKNRIDRFINFLDLQLKLDKPKVSPHQAIRSIAKTVYIASAIRPKWYPSTPSTPYELDPNQLPIPYANDRVITILTRHLNNSNSRIRAAAIGWLSVVGANDMSKSERIVGYLEAQITKEASLNKTKKYKERMVKHARQSLEQLRREIDKRRFRKQTAPPAPPSSPEPPKMPEAQPIFDSGPAGRAGRPLSSSERSDYKDYKDRKALEAYEKRNAEIDSWIKENSIPDHKNAALLYYQALLLKPDHDMTVINKFYDVCGGLEPDTQVRTYLGEWLPSMKMSEIASRIPQCTWGAWSEPTIDLHFLNGELRQPFYVIAADAITLAYDGHYRAALQRCMTLRRIARHLSYDSKLHFTSSAFDGIAIRTISRILGVMPPDADILAWFQDQLAMFHEPTTFLERTLQQYQKAKMDMVQSCSIASLRDMLLRTVADEQVRQNIRDLTDEQIRAKAIETLQVPIDSVFAILNSDKNAEQKHAEIQQLADHAVKTNVPELTMMFFSTYFNGELGKDILTVGIGPEMTEEQKLAKIRKIIDKRVAPDAIQLLTKISNALGLEIDLGFLANSEMTDEQRLGQMQKFLNELREAYRIERTIEVKWHVINALFERQVRHTAQLNIIKAAVEIYLIVAKTGQLPKILPDGLPKDPVTGRNLVYEITHEGFNLHCQGEEFLRPKIRFLEFKVKK